MKDSIKPKYYEINHKLETEQLPFSVELGDMTFKDAEELRYELMRPSLRIEIYEEFKKLHFGIYSR